MACRLRRREPRANGLAHGRTAISLTPLNDLVAREQALSDRFGDVLGWSERMRELFADLERIARAISRC